MCCLLFAVCCLFVDVLSLLRVSWLLLFGVLVFDFCCLRLSFVVSSLFVVCCLCLLRVAILFRVLCVVWCMLLVACCLLCVACCLPLSVFRCVLFVASCLSVLFVVF